MHVIEAGSVDEALELGVRYLLERGGEEPSRNGPVLVAPGPVTTLYRRPRNRVLFNAERDANPFFHLMEALWMLAGRNDVAYVAQFAKQIAAYSDDGVTQRGAYGYRWRSWFGYDQLNVIIHQLRADPFTRRAVLAMWDAGNPDPEVLNSDLLVTTADKPCNTHVYFAARDGGTVLDMTVCNRSNDILWGAYGANAVHMSFLHEVVAVATGLRLGHYYQVSNNYHLYLDKFSRDKLQLMMRSAADSGYYYDPEMLENRLVGINFDSWSAFTAQLRDFVDGDWKLINDPFLLGVAIPMRLAHAAYKANQVSVAQTHLSNVTAPDWRRAGREWLKRRSVK